MWEFLVGRQRGVERIGAYMCESHSISTSQLLRGTLFDDFIVVA
jgi:hypothetical protein